MVSIATRALTPFPAVREQSEQQRLLFRDSMQALTPHVVELQQLEVLGGQDVQVGGLGR